MRRPAEMLLAVMLAASLQVGGAADAGPADAATDTAYFAGGCFWCTEADFKAVPGVIEVTSGYMQGHVPSPSYEQVLTGSTGHTEAVRVRFDPARVSYETLVAFHWRNIDPTVADRQFCDSGSQYRSGIYWRDGTQRAVAEASLADMRERFDRVHTEIDEAGRFWEAEDFHQDYAERNPLRYRFYRQRCGRDARLRQLWGDEAGGRRLIETAR